LLHRKLSERVIGAFFETYNELGFGFLESVYENALGMQLESLGLAVKRQYPILVQFKQRVVGEFRADLLVEDCMIIEIKAVNSLAAVHEAQLINYLKATGIRVGLLLNFGRRPQFRRKIF
jgi:GxxExxY protein